MQTDEKIKIIENCIDFAKAFLYLPGAVAVGFDDCPSQRFPTESNACETSRKGSAVTLWFNRVWFDKQLDGHVDNIEFFVFHELRHMHQMLSIELLANGQKTQESQGEIRKWQHEFDNYIRNVDKVTEEQNIRQSIEMDANAYGVCLVNLYHFHDDKELRLSLPTQTETEVSSLAQSYLAAKPELKRFIDREQRRMTARPVPKPDVNGLCPCGSGRKFKKCCRGKGIYD